MVRRSRPENGHSQPQRGRKLLSPNGHVGRNSKLPKRREPQLKNLRIFFQFTSAHSEPSHCIRACFCPRRKQAGSRPKDSTQPQRKPRGLEPGDPRHRTAPASNSQEESAQPSQETRAHTQNPRLIPHGKFEARSLEFCVALALSQSSRNVDRGPKTRYTG